MTLPILLLDLDGVLANLFARVRLEVAALAERDGFQHQLPERPTQWRMNAPDEPTNHAVETAFRTPGLFASLDPIPGAVESVRRLHRRGQVDVLFCSSPYQSNPTCADDKRAWLRRHLGSWAPGRLVLTADKTIVHGSLLVDDKPEIAGRLPTPRWRQVFYTQPYNALQPGLRIDQWSEASVEQVEAWAWKERQ